MVLKLKKKGLDEKIPYDAFFGSFEGGNWSRQTKIDTLYKNETKQHGILPAWRVI